MTIHTSSIELSEIELNLHLGWPDNERAHKQKIHVNLLLQFTQPPAACVTDDLTDTYCYDSLVQMIVKEVEAKEFRLIEHLGFHIYQIIKKSEPNIHAIKVSIIKKPQVARLTGGVVFTYGDVC